MPGKPAPDWYPDPENPALLRWWDGARWSGETRPAAEAAAGPGQPPAGQPIPGHVDPAPFGGIEIPASPVTGPGGPPGTAFPAESRRGASLQASWREPALESWAAVYRSTGPAAGRDAFPARRWVLGG